MRKRLVITALLAVAGLAATSVPASAATGASHDGFAAGVVRLDGAQEAPQPGDPDGRGLFGYAAFGSRLCYVLTARKIEPATAAHIHEGPPGVAGPITVGLEAPTDGLSADCIRVAPEGTPEGPDVLTQAEFDAIVADPSAFYVNVHNEPFPAGAIRAQLR
jgi:hypothetical protein